MTSILDRLTDAMTATADTVREPELRPLTEPPRQRQRRPGRARRPDGGRRRWVWAAPVAAGAAIMLVIGLSVSISNGVFGTQHPAAASHQQGAHTDPTAAPLHLHWPGLHTHKLVASTHQPAAPHKFYVGTDLAGNETIVRSTATGQAVAMVPVPPSSYMSPVATVLATARNGTFYLAAFSRQTQREQIYRFKLTSAGHVSGFAPVTGGLLRRGWGVSALAVSPDGSMVAASTFNNDGIKTLSNGMVTAKDYADLLVIIHTATGVQTTWPGGAISSAYRHFRTASLSWASDHQLAVLGQWTPTAAEDGGEDYTIPQRQAQLRVIDPTSLAGGTVAAGHLLLAQSPQLPYLAQALLSPDGSVITAIVLRGQVGTHGLYPPDLSVEQISAATGHQLGALFHQRLSAQTGEASGNFAPLRLVGDPAGTGLILYSGIVRWRTNVDELNGWIHAGQLITTRFPGGHNREASEAW
jgi:hypothetical protein